MARIAIIADDLTGALDTASPFAGRGRRVHVALAPDLLAEAIAASPEVLAVSTNSRGLGGDKAEAVARDAADRLRPWRPDLVLKKVDSRLKGNIARETAAVASVFGLSRIRAAVAVPGQGRVVRNGKVEGVGVESPLPVAAYLPAAAAAVLDAVTDEDLDRIAGNWRAGDGVLFVCASGLAAAFARRCGGPGAPSPFVARLPVIVAVGSRDPITGSQIARLVETASEALLVEAPDGILPADRGTAPIMVYACKGEVTGPGGVVARLFARGVAAEVGRLRPSTIVTTGGDTTLAVLRALGIRTLALHGEAAPGLPWFELPGPEGGTIAAVSKSGGFGGPDVLSRILAPTGSDSRPVYAISAVKSS